MSFNLSAIAWSHAIALKFYGLPMDATCIFAALANGGRHVNASKARSPNHVMFEKAILDWPFEARQLKKCWHKHQWLGFGHLPLPKCIQGTIQKWLKQCYPQPDVHFRRAHTISAGIQMEWS